MSWAGFSDDRLHNHESLSAAGAARCGAVASAIPAGAFPPMIADAEIESVGCRTRDVALLEVRCIPSPCLVDHLDLLRVLDTLRCSATIGKNTNAQISDLGRFVAWSSTSALIALHTVWHI